MAQLIVRRLDDDVKKRLKTRAKRHGRSLEAEARVILEDAAKREPSEIDMKTGLGTQIARRFRGTNTIEAAFIDAAAEHGFELIWTIFGSAIPGGPVSQDVALEIVVESALEWIVRELVGNEGPG